MLRRRNIISRAVIAAVRQENIFNPMFLQKVFYFCFVIRKEYFVSIDYTCCGGMIRDRNCFYVWSKISCGVIKVSLKTMLFCGISDDFIGCRGSYLNEANKNSAVQM